MAILKFSHKHAPELGDGTDPEFFVSSLYISVAIKHRFLKFNMFSRYKHNNSKLALNFFLT